MTKKLETLLAKQARLNAQVTRAKALERNRQSKQRRKDDTSRKIVTGALALEHAAQNPQSPFAQTLFHLLDHHTPDNRRHLFDLDSMRQAFTASNDDSKSILRSLFRGKARNSK